MLKRGLRCQLALLGLAGVLFLAELKVPSFGLLTVGILGSGVALLSSKSVSMFLRDRCDSRSRTVSLFLRAMWVVTLAAAVWTVFVDLMRL